MEIFASTFEVLSSKHKNWIVMLNTLHLTIADFHLCTVCSIRDFANFPVFLNCPFPPPPHWPSCASSSLFRNVSPVSPRLTHRRKKEIFGQLGPPCTVTYIQYCYNPPAKYVIGQLVNPLANGSLFVHGSTHSPITLRTDLPTKCLDHQRSTLASKMWPVGSKNLRFYHSLLKKGMVK